MKKRTFLVNKIVRDFSQKLFVQEGSGAQVTTKQLTHKEQIHHFKQKLHEEVLEVVQANDLATLKEELADVLEVLYGFANALEGTVESIERIRKNKKTKRVVFKKHFL